MLFLKKYSLCFFFLFNLLPFPGKAIEVLELGDELNTYVFNGNYLEVFFDSLNHYSIKDVSSPGFKLFKKDSKEVPHYSTGLNASIWLKVIVKNNSSQNHNWLLELYDFEIDLFEIYIPDGNGGFILKKGGDHFPFSHKAILHKNFVFEIPNPSSQPQSYYIKIQSERSVATFGVFRQAKKLIYYSSNEYFALALFYGIALSMILYNYFLFFTIRDFAYLWFILYVFSISVYAMCHDGTGFQYLWPEFPQLNNYIQELSLFSLIVFAILYARSFLNTPKDLPGHDKILLICIGLRTVIYLGVFSNLIPPNIEVLYFDLLIMIYLYFTGLLSWQKGFTPARYYIYAFSVLFIGFLITSLEDLGWIINDWYTVYAMNIGATGEMMLLSMALADRVKVLMNEKQDFQSKMIGQLKENQKLKDEINEQLENKVDKRTREINKMIVELESKNQELENANNQLKMLNDKVHVMNSMLKMDNEKLSTDILEISRSRILLHDVKLDEFQKVFPDESSCLNYLAELKWKKEYSCRKCGYQKWSKSKFPFGKRCKNCNYDESPTAETLFHNLKFPVTKAFYMIYLVSVKDKKIRLEELSEILDLRKETCWRFRKKIISAKQNLIKKGMKEETDGWGALAMISIKE